MPTTRGRASELVTIHTDCPVTFDPDACRYTGADRATPSSCSPSWRSARWFREYAPTADAVERDYAVVEPSGLDALVAQCSAAGQFALHVVTDGDSPMRADARRPQRLDRRVRGALRAARAHARHRRCAPLQQRKAASSTTSRPCRAGRATLPAALRALLEDPAVKKVGHGLKQAAVVLAEHGVTLAGIDIDTGWRAICSTRTARSPSSRTIALELLTYKALRRGDVVGKGAKAISARRSAAGDAADLRRRARRPRRAGRADASPEQMQTADARRRSTRRSSCR